MRLHWNTFTLSDWLEDVEMETTWRDASQNIVFRSLYSFLLRTHLIYLTKSEWWSNALFYNKTLSRLVYLFQIYTWFLLMDVEAQAHCLSKTVWGFSIFDSVSLLLKFIVLFTKCKDSQMQKPFKIKKIEKPPTVLLGGLWFLSCNKKF